MGNSKLKLAALPRAARRAKWRAQIKTLSQSKDAKKSGLPRAERRQRAKQIWTTSCPSTRVAGRWGHYMSARIDSLQTGLMVLHNPKMYME